MTNFGITEMQINSLIAFKSDYDSRTCSPEPGMEHASDLYLFSASLYLYAGFEVGVSGTMIEKIAIPLLTGALSKEDLWGFLSEVDSNQREIDGVTEQIYENFINDAGIKFSPGGN